MNKAPLRLGIRQRCPFSQQLVLQVLANPIRQEKEIKVLQIGVKEVKRSLFAGSTIIFVENFKEPTKESYSN